MMEQWRVIPDTDGLYWASDMGRVKALARVINGRKMKEKILRLTPHSDGYVQARINGKGQLVHRLVYLAWFISPGLAQFQRECWSGILTTFPPTTGFPILRWVTQPLTLLMPSGTVAVTVSLFLRRKVRSCEPGFWPTHLSAMRRFACSLHPLVAHLALFAGIKPKCVRLAYYKDGEFPAPGPV